MQQTELRQQIIRLRKEGASFSEIERQTGYNRQSVAAIIKKEMAKVSESMVEDVKSLRAMELIRMDALWDSIYDKATAGDIKAIETCLKISERRAKLAGLDIQPKAAPTLQFFNLSDTELMEEAKRAGVDVPLELTDDTAGTLHPTPPGQVLPHCEGEGARVAMADENGRNTLDVEYDVLEQRPSVGCGD